MNPKEIIFITSRNRFFGQTRKPWTSLKTDRIIALIQEQGYLVKQYDFHDIINQEEIIRDKVIIYAFSQKKHYLEYIKDIVYHLSKYNKVIPSYELLLCHENKGYQEILKKEKGLNELKGAYYTSVREIDFSDITFPVILKTTEGSNGTGVYLIQNKEQLKKTRKELQKKFSLPTKLDLFRRKYFRRKKFKDYPDFSNRQDYYEYKEHITQETNFILQEFIPDLSYDYRVLIAFDRYYVSRRDTKPGDFRASGSKLHNPLHEPNDKLLNYARTIYGHFDSPFLSIDVVFDGKNYYMIEFQALHFGQNVIIKTEGYFRKQDTKNWEFIKEKPDLEKIFAVTYVSYLNNLSNPG